MADIETRVVIVGGGPAGLILAIELGRRGVACVVLEQSVDPRAFPKASTSTPRTMEHYRRLGLVDDIRALGLPDDYPLDISYYTHFGDYELGRFKRPSRRETMASRRKDPSALTPEPMHRAQQMYIEPVLRRAAQSIPVVDLRLGWRVQSIEQKADGVAARAVELSSGKSFEIVGDYLVGCDGARSVVRAAAGIKYEGPGAESGEFMGGRMLATYFRSPEFYSFTPKRRSWQYWAINKKRFGTLVALDGVELFVLHAQLPHGVEKSEAFARESVEIAAGRKFDYEIIEFSEWTAGLTLVAERFGTSRIFLAGDAAHLFTPTAGLGYNTSVDDAANLGWKLAAVCLGWGGPNLLPSYAVERKPVAERNTEFARSMGAHFRSMTLPEALEAAGPEGDAARAEYGKHLEHVAAQEFDAQGIYFGTYYGSSPIVMTEAGDPAVDDPIRYIPDARAGARAPHVWLGDDVALYDRFGRDFTLLRLNPNADAGGFESAAKARGVPLSVVTVENQDARDLYTHDLILVRPDQHVAWRGNTASDAERVIAKATGA